MKAGRNKSRERSRGGRVCSAHSNQLLFLKKTTARGLSLFENKKEGHTHKPYFSPPFSQIKQYKRIQVCHECVCVCVWGARCRMLSSWGCQRKMWQTCTGHSKKNKRETSQYNRRAVEVRERGRETVGEVQIRTRHLFRQSALDNLLKCHLR